MESFVTLLRAFERLKLVEWYLCIHTILPIDAYRMAELFCIPAIVVIDFCHLTVMFRKHLMLDTSHELSLLTNTIESAVQQMLMTPSHSLITT